MVSDSFPVNKNTITPVRQVAITRQLIVFLKLLIREVFSLDSIIDFQGLHIELNSTRAWSGKVRPMERLPMRVNFRVFLSLNVFAMWIFVTYLSTYLCMYLF